MTAIVFYLLVVLFLLALGARAARRRLLGGDAVSALRRASRALRTSQRQLRAQNGHRKPAPWPPEASA